MTLSQSKCKKYFKQETGCKDSSITHSIRKPIGI